MKHRFILLAVVVSACVGCSTNVPPKMNVPDVDMVRAAKKGWDANLSLETIQNLEGFEGNESMALENESKDGSRYLALKDAAYQLGIQGGLYKRRIKINELLKKAQPQLSRIFDFSSYMLPGNVFPPVITETKGMIQQNGRKELRANRHAYHIVTMPQLVIEPPNYLNYLVRHYPAPTRPDSLRLPVGEVEKKNWAIWVAEGWKIGVQQANLQYESDKNRLERDLAGIRLFHDLVAKGVLTMPRIAQQDFGVVKSEDGRTLTIGDEVLSIVKDSHFNSSEKWTPIVGEAIDE